MSPRKAVPSLHPVAEDDLVRKNSQSGASSSTSSQQGRDATALEQGSDRGNGGQADQPKAGRSSQQSCPLAERPFRTACPSPGSPRLRRRLQEQLPDTATQAEIRLAIATDERDQGRLQHPQTRAEPAAGRRHRQAVRERVRPLARTPRPLLAKAGPRLRDGTDIGALASTTTIADQLDARTSARIVIIEARVRLWTPVHRSARTSWRASSPSSTKPHGARPCSGIYRTEHLLSEHGQMVVQPYLKITPSRPLHLDPFVSRDAIVQGGSCSTTWRVNPGPGPTRVSQNRPRARHRVSVHPDEPSTMAPGRTIATISGSRGPWDPTLSASTFSTWGVQRGRPPVASPNWRTRSTSLR